MKTNDKILLYLRSRPSYTGSLTGITAHIKLPALVVKAHMTALHSGEMVRRLPVEGEAILYHLTMKGFDYASCLQPETPLMPHSAAH